MKTAKLPTARLRDVRIETAVMPPWYDERNPYEGIGRLRLETKGYFHLENGGYILLEKQ